MFSYNIFHPGTEWKHKNTEEALRYENSKTLEPLRRIMMHRLDIWENVRCKFHTVQKY
jgi:hypothetical protein